MLVNGVTQLPSAPPSARAMAQCPWTMTSGTTPKRITTSSAPSFPRLRLAMKISTFVPMRAHVTMGVRRV